MKRAVTVDTGGPDDVFPGALVMWLHTPRGGYGYSISIPAKVVSHGRTPSTRVCVEVHRRDGSPTKRHVDARNLRWREIGERDPARPEDKP